MCGLLTGTNLSRAGGYLHIAKVTGGEGAVERHSHKLTPGEKIVLMPEFGGGEITPAQLEVAAAYANLYWRMLQTKKIRLSDAQFRQAITLILQMAKDNAMDPAVTGCWMTQTRALQGDRRVADWVEHPELVRNLPIFKDVAGMPPPPDQLLRLVK